MRVRSSRHRNVVKRIVDHVHRFGESSAREAFTEVRGATLAAAIEQAREQGHVVHQQRRR